MSKILQKSRALLLNKSRIRSYVLYTLGEIGLVVIGILIALSIDDWNEGRKDLIKEQEVLVQLRKDYQSNLIQLDEKIGIRESIVRSSESVLKAIDQPTEQNYDSVINKLAVLIIDPTFDPINDDVLNSGNIRLIRNQQLRRLLTNWSSDVVAVTEIERAWQSQINELLVPFYIDIGISRDAVNSFWNKNDWFLDKGVSGKIQLRKSRMAPKVGAFLGNPKLEGLLAMAVLYNYSGNIQSYSLRARILEILELLDKEITAGVK